MNAVPISQRSIAGPKRTIEAITGGKRPRSKFPRRRRVPLLPIVAGTSNTDFGDDLEEESSSSCLYSDVSFDSSLRFAGSEVTKQMASNRSTKRKMLVTEQSSGGDFRRITRSHTKRQRMLRSGEKTNDVSGGGDLLLKGSEPELSLGDAASEIQISEVTQVTGGFHVGNLNENVVSSELTVEFPAISESSCFESVSDAKSARICDSVADEGSSLGDAASEIQISEVTQVTGGFHFGNLNENVVSSEMTEAFPAISESSCFESVSDAKSARICDSVADEGSSLQIAGDPSLPNEATSYGADLYSYLACSEQISEADDEGVGYSTCNEMTLSEKESAISTRSSDRGSSEYSLSDPFSSPDDYSGWSSENSSPCVTFSLFRQLAEKFVKSSSGIYSEETPGTPQIDSSQEFMPLRFELREDEESYKNIRSRERREVMLHDLGEEYNSSTNHGRLILQQRLRMVNWMVEQSQATELHHETLFLGVSLMDRVLSRGYFESEKNIQLLGIASITLATRLEEVRPWNSIRRRNFTVGSNVYARSEVVAMEWLLLEIISFYCMIPTTHNFLWFYLKAAKADAEVEALSRRLAVLSLLDHRRLCFWPSTVAAGFVILACIATNRDAAAFRVLETHVRSRSDDLPECIQSFEWLVKFAS